MDSARSWIPQKSTLCRIEEETKKTLQKRTCQWRCHRTSLDAVSPSCHVDWKASSRAEERACLCIVRLEVQIDEVVVDMQDKDSAMALRRVSVMSWLWADCTLATVCEQVAGQIAEMLNGLGGD